MFEKYQNQMAFSLLEVLLAAVIFVISIGGVFIALGVMRKPVADKESALSSAVFGKQVLEALRSQVNANTYYNNCSSVVAGKCQDFSLYLGSHLVPTANFPTSLTWPTGLAAANGNSLSYTVSCADGGAQTVDPNTGAPDCDSQDIARKVDLNITWSDAP